jgi:hypothetical protein
LLDALLDNYDRLDSTYQRAMSAKPRSPLRWTRHDFGNHFSHLMTDGDAFTLFDRAASLGKRSKRFYAEKNSMFFTVIVENT